MSISRFWMVGLACALVAVVAGCAPGKGGADAAKADSVRPINDAANAAARQEIVIPVRVDYPERGDISSYIETFTRLEAENQVEITSQAVGRCVAVHVEEGDRVKTGEVLAELDKTEAEASVSQARVQVQQRRVEYDRAKKGAPLVMSQAELDAARFAYEQAQASLELQEAQLSNLTIRAPFDGVIARKEIQPGMLVSSGRPAFRLVDPQSLMLAINVEERKLPQLGIGQPAEVVFDALPEKAFTARVRRINPTVEQGSVKVTLDLDDASRKGLKEGLFARVRLVVDTHKEAVLVPKDAIVEESGRKYLFIVKGEALESQPAEASGLNGVAERIEVTTGYDTSDRIEILSGVETASPVVVLGQQTLKPGTPVRVTDAGAALAEKAGMTAEQALVAAEAEKAAAKEDHDETSAGQ